MTDKTDAGRGAADGKKITDKSEADTPRPDVKTETAVMIDDRTGSFQMTLDSIPGPVFFKDISTGRYLACNQAFAIFAGLDRPADIRNRSDHDIFDSEAADRFVAADQKALSLSCPYVCFEKASDATGSVRHFKTTRLRSADLSGRLCLVGMSEDVTELTRIREETKETRIAYEAARSSSLTYSHIAHALASDYSYIYYVDLETDDYIEYKSDAIHSVLAEETGGTDFFNISRRRARTILFEDDLPMFLNTFKKRVILSVLDQYGTFTLTYRQLFNGEPVYMNMKITRMGAEDPNLIIGISNVDAQMRYQEAIERMQDERSTYARVTALSGDFICVYTVDPENEHYSRFSVMREYEKLGLPRVGESFFSQFRDEAIRLVHPEDLARFESIFTKENVLDEIRHNGIFAFSYRMMLNGIPIYVMMKGAVIREKNLPQLIIGIINIDSQVRREQEYEYNLAAARSKANIDGLTGVKNKHAYNEAEAELNRLISEDPDVRFAIIALDVNNLKLVNDTKGHSEGDKLLKQASGIICRIFAHSPVFRVGGDEFTVISQGEDYDNVEALLTQLRESNERNLLTGDAIIAGGLARYEGDPDVQTVYERADGIMYLEKKRLKTITGTLEERMK